MTQSKKVLISIVSEVSLKRLPPPPQKHGQERERTRVKSSLSPLPPLTHPWVKEWTRLTFHTSFFANVFRLYRPPKAERMLATGNDTEQTANITIVPFIFFSDFQLWSYLWRGAKICWEVASSVQPSSDRKRSKAEGGNPVRKHQRSCQVCYFFCVNWGLFRGYNCLSF